MARETRIGMIVMVLLVGAFGFLVYQRWNSQQPTLLVQAAELHDQMKSSSDPKQPPEEKSSSDDHQTTAAPKPPSPPRGSTAATVPSSSASKEQRGERRIVPARPPAAHGGKKKSEQPANLKSKKTPSVPPVRSNPFAAMAAKASADAAPPEKKQPDNKQPGGVAKPVASSPNPFAAIAGGAAASPPAGKPQPDIAASEQPAAKTSVASAAKKSDEKTPETVAKSPAAGPFAGVATLSDAQTDPKTKEPPAASPPPTADSAPSPFSAMTTLGPMSKKPEKTVKTEETEKPETPARDASPVKSELADTEVAPFGPLSPAGEPKPSATPPAKSTPSPFDNPPSKIAQESPLPEKPVVAEIPPAQESPSPFAALEDIASDPPATQDTATQDTATQEGASGTWNSTSEPAGPVTLKADPFADVAGAMARDETNTASPATKTAKATGTANAANSEPAPPFSPPSSTEPPPPSSLGESAAPEMASDASFGPSSEAASPAEKTFHKTTPDAELPQAPPTKKALFHPTYSVKENDTFWSISQSAYGTPIYANALAYHNAKQVDDPQHLAPGTEIVTPPVEVLRERYRALIATGTRAAARLQRQPGFFVTETGAPAYRVTGKVSGKKTLEKIAQAHLARSSRWIQIFQMNRDQLRRPDDLAAGMVLELPVDASRVRLVPKGEATSTSEK